MILTAVLMLQHIDERDAADRIERALAAVIQEGKNVTYDLTDGESVGTSEMTDAIIERL